MASKRKHVTLTLKLKHEILEQLERGISGNQLAKKYGIGTSTVSDIKKRKTKLESFIAKCDSDPGSRKTLKKAEHPEMEAELYSWILRQKSRHAPVSYEILVQKAKQLFVKCYGKSNFNASSGWITNFKKRYGVLKISGGKLTNTSSLIEPFKKKLQEKIENLNLLPSQIYNTDSSALFWKFLPPSKEEDPLKEPNKERITFMVCCNADGSHKLKPLVIGKPIYKNLQVPLEYKSTPDALMTSQIFAEWFYNSFIIQVRNFSKTHNNVLLLVASNHVQDDLVSEDGKIVTMFLPLNCTALIQNVISLIKLSYRKSLLSHILSSQTKDRNYKSLNLKKAFKFVCEAWEKVSADTLFNCWNELLDGEWKDDKSLSKREADYLKISEMLKQVTENESTTECEVKEWVEEDDVSEYEQNEENVEEIKQEKEEVGEIEEYQANAAPVSNDEATHCFNLCLQWAEENDVASNEILMLRKLKERAFLLSQNDLKPHFVQLNNFQMFKLE